MTEPTDIPGAWIDHLSAAPAGQKRLEQLAYLNLRPEERDAVMLRLLASRERLKASAVALLKHVDDASEILASGANDFSEVLGGL